MTEINGMSNKVSIIVPVYNTERYIERCARSLFNQTFDNIEYIFVDDCTQDDSMDRLWEIIQEYPEREKSVRICIHETNKGLPAARNTGISVATGKYVIHCDSDDWVDDTYISTMYDRIVSADVDIVWSDYYVSFADHDEVVPQLIAENRILCMKALLTENMHGGVWNKLVRRSLYTDNGVCFPEGVSMWEDLNTTFRLFFFAKKVAYCPGAFYHYNQDNEMSLCNSISSRKLDELLTNCEGILSFIEERGLSRKLFLETNIVKLAAKQTLLFTLDKRQFERWRTIYPEANKYIWKYTSFPWRLRFIGWCASKRMGGIISLWIFLKKRIDRKK